jgi:hypothetical protein
VALAAKHHDLLVKWLGISSYRTRDPYHNWTGPGGRAPAGRTGAARSGRSRALTLPVSLFAVPVRAAAATHPLEREQPNNHSLHLVASVRLMRRSNDALDHRCALDVLDTRAIRPTSRSPRNRLAPARPAPVHDQRRALEEQLAHPNRSRQRRRPSRSSGAPHPQASHASDEPGTHLGRRRPDVLPFGGGLKPRLAQNPGGQRLSTACRLLTTTPGTDPIVAGAPSWCSSDGIVPVTVTTQAHARMTIPELTGP